MANDSKKQSVKLRSGCPTSETAETSVRDLITWSTIEVDAMLFFYVPCRSILQLYLKDRIARDGIANVGFEQT